jgi:hypothetical protein
VRVKLKLVVATAALVAAACGESGASLNRIGNGHPNDAEYIAAVRNVADNYDVTGDTSNADLFEVARRFCNQWRADGFAEWAGYIRSIQDEYQLYMFVYTTSALAAWHYCDDMRSDLIAATVEYDLQP